MHSGAECATGHCQAQLRWHATARTTQTLLRAFAAEDTAAALRLTCRTLRAAVNGAVKQLTMRAASSEDINQAASRCTGLHVCCTQARLLAHLCDMSSASLPPQTEVMPAPVVVDAQAVGGFTCTFQGRHQRNDDLARTNATPGRHQVHSAVCYKSGCEDASASAVVFCDPWYRLRKVMHTGSRQIVCSTGSYSWTGGALHSS